MRGPLRIAALFRLVPVRTMPTKSQFDAAGYLRKRYADHLSQGLCRWCDEPICADSICMCDYHLRLHRKAARKRYWKGKLA